ncbi:hypothetical Protein YC6258_01161 [Gynuella sunshinyii YC6258]|uniref:Uncharacterized protein n=1 Tax=Gynuella sunshinyii YC6258 TaxID=1445510 RepID=A0A0C5VSF7_9GAMM|nr:hypothetical Protein YC6258_01161 [Gynuella sunshinyii YC6258]
MNKKAIIEYRKDTGTMAGRSHLARGLSIQPERKTELLLDKCFPVSNH